MTVRLLGLDCSPRDNSNSGIMLDTGFTALDETYPGEAECEIVRLRDLDIEPCKACNVCGKTKDGRFIPCVREDEDDVQGVLDKMVAADGILVGTPVYFGLPTGPVLEVHHAHAPAAAPGFQAGQQAGRGDGRGRAPLRRRRDGHPRHLAALRAQRLPRRGQRRRHLPVRRLRLGRPSRPRAQRRVGSRAGCQTTERVFTLARPLKAGVEASGFVNPMKFSYSAGTRS